MIDMKRIVVGISGASGIPLAVSLLSKLKKMPEIETHLVMSDGAKVTMALETQYSLNDVCELADVVYDNMNISASIASGTFIVDGMIIVPCSMKTVAGIASGYSDNLLLRASDVMIKEKRKLVLVARESPFSLIHLDNLSYLAKLSNIVIMPMMMSYYQWPQSIQEMENNVIGKILSQFGIEFDEFVRWK